jgi:uncharacterized protein YjiS (DUF1127 family)
MTPSSAWRFFRHWHRRRVSLWALGVCRRHIEYR